MIGSILARTRKKGTLQSQKNWHRLKAWTIPQLDTHAASKHVGTGSAAKLYCYVLLPDQLQCWQAEVLRTSTDTSPAMEGATTMLQPTQRAQAHWNRVLHAGTAGAPRACPAAHGCPAAAGMDRPQGQMKDESSRTTTASVVSVNHGCKICTSSTHLLHFAYASSAAVLWHHSQPHASRRAVDTPHTLALTPSFTNRPSRFHCT